MIQTTEETLLRLVDHDKSSGSDTPARCIRLMVVDEHPLVRWALRQIAADLADVEVVGEVADAAHGTAQMFAFKPDVVTVDCSQPASDGWRLIRDLRQQNPDLGIVVLTSGGSDDELFRALDSGASAFVSKSAPIQEIMSAIRHAAFASSAFSAAGLGQAMRRRREHTERAALSARERQILLLLHDGMSVPAIAKELFVSLSTAKTYVARLYDKLEARNRAQALMSAVRLGLFEDCRASAGFASAAV
jgi:DNA-binding NarL/FixJ family response regulator